MPLGAFAGNLLGMKPLHVWPTDATHLAIASDGTEISNAHKKKSRLNLF